MSIVLETNVAPKETLKNLQKEISDLICDWVNNPYFMMFEKGFELASTEAMEFQNSLSTIMGKYMGRLEDSYFASNELSFMIGNNAYNAIRWELFILMEEGKMFIEDAELHILELKWAFKKKSHSVRFFANKIVNKLFAWNGGKISLEHAILDPCFGELGK